MHQGLGFVPGWAAVGGGGLRESCRFVLFWGFCMGVVSS